MIYLICSILISSLLFVIFKLFEVYKVNTLHAIVINYTVASIIGFTAYEGDITYNQIPAQPWFISSLILAVIFISVFIVMAKTSQYNGLSVASVAGKMSVVIPVIFGLWAYQEQLTAAKIIGILIALVAVYLTSIKRKTGIIKRSTLIFPLLLFIGSGVIDATIKYIEDRYLGHNGIPVFSATVFGCAGIIGYLVIGIQFLRKQFVFDFRNLIAGIFLGIPNYFSIYFLLKALKTDGLDSSTLFTINNVAIVMLTSLCGLLLFKEKLITKNWIGIGLAIISIVIITLL